MGDFIRKRGGKLHRPSRKSYIEPKHEVSNTARLYDEGGIYYDCAEGETVEEHGTPRKSLTDQLHLKVFPQLFETEERAEKQRDRKTGKLVGVTRPRIVWKSDKTLLRGGKPEQFGGERGTKFIRTTSRSKVNRTETEYQQVVREVPINPYEGKI
jgi:hypothetical protein